MIWLEFCTVWFGLMLLLLAQYFSFPIYFTQTPNWLTLFGTCSGIFDFLFIYDENFSLEKKFRFVWLCANHWKFIETFCLPDPFRSCSGMFGSILKILIHYLPVHFFPLLQGTFLLFFFSVKFGYFVWRPVFSVFQ